MMTPNEYGIIGYETYAKFTGGKTWDGKPMPTWEDLPEKIQGAWGASGEAVVESYIDSMVQEWCDMTKSVNQDGSYRDYDMPNIDPFHEED
mgnify:CR=1 FL=1